jgi:hypothetical protein
VKKIVLILFISVPLSINAQWELNYVVPPGSLDCFTANDSFIFVGTYSGGVYLSSNNGQNWVPSQGMTYGWVLSMAARNSNIFAGMAQLDGVYLSTNNGSSWFRTSLDFVSVSSITITNSTVLAADYDGVYLSTNNGLNWSKKIINNLNVHSLTSNEHGVFAGTSWGVYYSSDNGQTWAVTPLDSIDIWVVYACGSNIIAGTSINGVFVSNDNGQTWTNTSLNYQDIFSVTAVGSNIFVGTWLQGVYLSTDNGLHWNQKNEGLGNLNILALQIFGGYIYAGSFQGCIWRRPLSELIGINKIGSEVPKEFLLYQNYPNPFNPVTKIKFDIPPSKGARGMTSIIIYDILGREVATLVNEQFNQGTYEVEWDGSNYPSGVYFYKLDAGEFTDTKKMILIK